MFVSRSVCLSVAQCVCQSLSVFVSRSVCLSVAQCVCQLLSVFASRSVCLPVTQCVCQSLSVFASCSVCLSVTQCVCQSLSVFSVCCYLVTAAEHKHRGRNLGNANPQLFDDTSTAPPAGYDQQQPFMPQPGVFHSYNNYSVAILPKVVVASEPSVFPNLALDQSV